MGTFPEPMFWKLADHFGSDIFLLCSHLGIPYREMQSISLAHPQNPKKWVVEALVQWQDNLEEGISKKEALDKMKNAFHEADRKDLVDVADELFEQYGGTNMSEQQLQGDGLRVAAIRAKGNIDAMVQAHASHKNKLKEAEETVKKVKDEMQQLKTQTSNKITGVQEESKQNQREAQEKVRQLEKEVKNLMITKSSEKNNNLKSSANKLAIPDDKLPSGVVQQFKAYNCACNLPSCVRCQVLPQAEELVGGGVLCQERQAAWQLRISAIKSGSRSVQEWRSLYACSDCHTFECWCQHNNTMVSILQLCQDQTDASPDVNTRSEVVAMMKVQTSLCEDAKAEWQDDINSLQQHQGTLQQWGNSKWLCAACHSVQCSHQFIPVEAKLVTTIEAMFQ